MSDQHEQTEAIEAEVGEAPQYAIVEVFGHRRLVGEVREVDRYGTKMLRIDMPIDGDFSNGVTTQFYGGSSIFSETPCDLETVKRLTAPRRPAGQYRLSAPDDDDDACDEELF